MELIDFAEKRGEEAAKFSLATMDINRARAHTLLSLLLGGAGAGVVLALSQHSLERPLLTVLAFAVSLWWFGLAAWLAVRGLRTSPVRPWAGGGSRILRKGAQWQNYAKEILAEGGVHEDYLTNLRVQELELMDDAVAEYRIASTQCGAALDTAYLVAALTPLPMVAAWALYRFFG